jgi:phage terminase small subunit
MSKKPNRKLTLKQEKFCQNYVSREFYGNGVQSYINAYDVDISKKGAYKSAQVKASQYLSKDIINARINSLLDEAGLNDNHVDKRLLHWINQNNEGNVSIQAIKEYNKLKERITDRVEVTTPIGSIVINPIKNDNKKS